MMYQVLLEASISLEMLAHSAPWHGGPLQDTVTVCDGTRGNSDSKEYVCTSYGANGGQCSEEFSWKLRNHRKAR